jgi:hypothetical protein
MRKALRLMAILAAFGLTAWIGVVALAQDSSAPNTSISTTTASPAPTVSVDVKGNCDEAEHANDPECVGANPVPEDGHENDDQGDVNDEDQGENEDSDDHDEDLGDDSQGENERNDDQGEVNDDDQGEDQDDDDQGDNSGPGSENSGPGSSNSGSGS